ncbi:hypothetical protein DSO57_1010122 [Entomophthora muscae]|uniref:Uncharacterized protein n=2 Tax=Entomophthora muscae TaxID=34485 RepID=A0ACC2S6L9_9FUNG|nr:hypothetical protein DSO57_1016856 [Entomophthora muscae]KAJ9066380.1 hypothetical protein DSO57_1010122 [Entomophthora muscae]
MLGRLMDRRQWPNAMPLHAGVGADASCVAMPLPPKYPQRRVNAEGVTFLMDRTGQVTALFKFLVFECASGGMVRGFGESVAFY